MVEGKGGVPEGVRRWPPAASRGAKGPFHPGERARGGAIIRGGLARKEAD
jgi:hypothetical protein